MRILILGAGGQGQVVADALYFAARAGHPQSAAGFLDDNPALWGAQIMGLTVFGPLAAWCETACDGLILGIGANQRRSQLFSALTAAGALFASVCHPTALLGYDVSVGPGTYIGAYAIAATGTRIGANTIVHGNSVVGHHNMVGAHVHLAPGVHTGGDVVIGAGVMVGLGANILPQRRVGDWAVVGAGALVQRDVAPGVTVVGVPARPIAPGH